MEISQNVQGKLKCSECDEILSCGPVYLLHETGGTICGRCCQQPQENDSNENNSRTRNSPYKAAASLLRFPCAFAARGCPEKLQFSLGCPAHESTCKFRPFFCPVEPRGSCGWIGPWPNLKQHFQDKHPTHLFQNPFVLPRPDLTKSSLSNFLVSAFRFLFLVHVKVCTSSGKLFHSLRMFGNPEMLDQFSYSLEIKGTDSKFVREGPVLRPGILMLQEPSANSILINNLLGFLGGKYDESKFSITIQTSIFLNCLNCTKNIDVVSDSEFCGECRVKLMTCIFNGNGCLFVDAHEYKCWRHDRYFCKYQTKCLNCEVDFVDGSFIEHLSSSTSCRKTTKANIHSVVRITQTTSNYDFILLSCKNIETIICSYLLFNSYIVLRLYTSLPFFELKNYECSIEFIDPQTKFTQIKTLQIRYDEWNDWSIYEDMNKFSSCENIGIDLKINIDKA